MLLTALLAFFQTQASSLPERRVANIFKPLATPATAEKEVGILVLLITLVIFLIVGGLIAFTIWRFRRKPDDDSRVEPPQVYGSNQIEVAWTVIPILIVFILIGVSARVIAGVQNASPSKSMVKLRVIGHQWWWQVEYPDFGIVTANEIHIPVSQNGANQTYLQLESLDVIHSFWVPQLSGKTDLIPNRINYMWIDPQQPGIYAGNCAEYCGTQHANMLLRVIAEPLADFQQWAAKQQKPGNESSQVAEAKQVFQSLSCVSCHNVKGTSSVGKFGPDLTHLMSRQTLASGVITNTPEHLRAWINDPQQIKPGALMPSFKLTNKQLDSVVAYLQTLD